MGTRLWLAWVLLLPPAQGVSPQGNATGCQDVSSIQGILPGPTLSLLADGAGEVLAPGCIVPGVSSSYKRIPDTAHGLTLDPPEGEHQPRGLQGQVPLPRLASWDAGVGMLPGDSPPATFPGLSQDSLSGEPTGSPEPSALVAPEPPGQLDRLLASCKLEQVLGQSWVHPRLSARHHALPPTPRNRPGGTVSVLGAEQEPTEAGANLEAGLEEAEVVSVAWGWWRWREYGTGGDPCSLSFSQELPRGGAFFAPN